MFYKVLLLELLVIGGLVTLRVRQSSPNETTEQVFPRATTPDRTTAVLPPPTKKALQRSIGKNDRFTFPVAGHGPKHIISNFGDKRGNRHHQGIDIKAPRGTEVIAIKDGFIERVREGGSGGKQVYLRDGKGRLYYYAHLDSWSVEEYAAVEAGEVLGTVGNTGNASGTTPHLHFEVLLGKEKEAINPRELFGGQAP